jgi:hypothetical protein
MQNRKTWRVVLPLLAAALAGIGWLMMERPHRDIGAEAARFRMVPQELVQAMAAGDSTSAVYLNEVVELFGVVDSDDGKRLALKGGVLASWDSTRTHRLLEAGELLRVKGRVTYYDDMFNEVRMDGLVLVHDPKP